MLPDEAIKHLQFLKDYMNKQIPDKNLLIPGIIRDEITSEINKLTQAVQIGIEAIVNNTIGVAGHQSKAVREFSKFLADKAQDGNINTCDLPDYAIEFFTTPYSTKINPPASADG